MGCPALPGWWSLRKGREGRTSHGEAYWEKAQVSAPPRGSQERQCQHAGSYSPATGRAQGRIP